MQQLTARLAQATIAGLALLAAARPAAARERLAVLVVADQEPALADDLTEVVIADLAERRDRELVGMRELRSRLGAVLPAEGLAACVADPACLVRLGAAAGAGEAVIATVSTRQGGYHVDLALFDTRTAKSEAHATADVNPGFDELVAALRAAVNELYPAEVAVPRPPPSADLSATAGAAAVTPTLIAKEGQGPRAPRWVPYAGAVATGLAAVAFSAAAVTGTIAMEEPTGATRAQVQADLEHRESYASFANGMIAVGTVLAVAAGAAFTYWWRSARGH